MAKKEGQKAKALLLLQILARESDEEHRLSVPQLVAALEKAGVPAERKSIYADLAALEAAGHSIDLRRGRGGGYCLIDRPFALAELKLLVDAVQSSRFITQRKSRQLIQKLEGLTSRYQASQLQRQVFVAGRAKSMNEAGIYAVDTLYQAISAGCMVKFQYMQWTLDKQKKPRRNGMYYEVSPWALAWENNCYYLIAYADYDGPGQIRHYRVDKMARVNLMDTPRRGRAVYENVDLAAYLQRQFNMYGGAPVQATLRCENGLAGVILDRFGTGVILCPEPDGAHFHVTLPVTDSPQFLGWVCGFAGGMTVLSPAPLRQKLRDMTAALAAAHTDSAE